MTGERRTAAQRRAEAVAAGMRVFGDHGLSTAAMQQVADEIGVSQPYVFRLFGSKQEFFLACLDELESRVHQVFRQASATRTSDPLRAIRAGFREAIADGVIPGLWLQACAVARTDEAVAARCRALLSGILVEAERLTAASPDDLAQSLASGALVMMLQALAVDLSGGGQAAVESLRAERRQS